jgi:hypothetical protein
MLNARQTQPPGAHRRLRLLLLTVLACLVVAAGLAVVAPGHAAAAEPTTLWLSAKTPVVSGESLTVYGSLGVTTLLTGQTVKIYKREKGESADTLITEVPVESLSAVGGYFNHFTATIPTATRTCIVTATWDGDADHLATSSWIVVGVRGKVTVAVPVRTRRMMKVVARVTPEQPVPTSPFPEKPASLFSVQRRIDGRWRPFPDAGVWSTDGKSWASFRYFDLEPGRYVLRARFLGTAFNTRALSAKVSVVVP